jgi:hypothetical protein
MHGDHDGTKPEMATRQLCQLEGNKVKNAGFIDSIIERLKTLTAEYRKVQGHNGDQGNDRADKLAVMGRDEAAAWPQCSFDVILPNAASIPFRVRSIPPKSTRAALFEVFTHETHARVSPPHEFQCYDSKAEVRTGDWISGHYKFATTLSPHLRCGLSRTRRKRRIQLSIDQSNMGYSVEVESPSLP